MEDALIIVDGPDGSSIPARIARGMTPALFGISKQAQRKFWEFSPPISGTRTRGVPT